IWEMRAENALSFAGRSYAVVLTTRSYGIRAMSFTTVDLGVDRKTCQARAVETVAALEAGYGRFSGGDGSYFASAPEAPSTPGRVEAHISPQGYPIISIVPPLRGLNSSSRTISAGIHSDLRILKSKDTFDVISELDSKGIEASVIFTGSY